MFRLLVDQHHFIQRPKLFFFRPFPIELCFSTTVSKMFDVSISSYKYSPHLICVGKLKKGKIIWKTTLILRIILMIPGLNAI